MCGLGRILGYIGGRPSVGATNMSQSGSGGLNDAQGQNQAGQTTDNQQTTCQNGRAEPLADSTKQDLSNGFENRTMDYEKFTQEKTQNTLIAGEVQDQQQQQLAHPVAQYPSGRRQSVGLPEDKHPSTGQLPPPQYSQEKSNADRTQHVSQTSTQTVPVQAYPQFASEYDQSQYPQIRGQFEVRSQIYPQTQYSDRAGYVTRDVTYRDPTLYSQSGATNPMFAGQGQYVTVQHGSQIPSQSASPQPPYYSGVIVPQPPSYTQFGTQPQYSYSQYPQTVMNALPYNPHTGSIYPAQQYPSQQSPNPQRFSQEIGQYQTQPIIQPIAQNVTHGIAIQTTERPCRGPKPMVPPRGNSKITTHDPGHRKSASVDVPALQKAKYESTPTAQQDSVHRNDGAVITGAPIGSDGSDRRYLTTINQNPRTRQDGLYVDTNGDQSGREKLVDTIATECGLYVSRSEHRKSISVDVTTSFQRRNDTITFTFPGDGNQEIISGRKATTATDAKRAETNQMFSTEQRRLDAGLRVSPMAFDTRQENRKSIGTDRKPEWGNVSPNQRNAIPSENRRSDYFEEHRRSPMNLESKRVEDVRRSPMPFVPIRETSVDRAGQKSPSFVSQNFEKTRQELAIWAEQRQRQEHERSIIQGPIFTSPRSRNPSEERRDIRSIHPLDDRKDSRMSQSAFQPIPNISQSTIMEQRRHLRHVSADLTKHMELSRKDFDEQPITGSVVNLGSVTSTASSQRASPNLCHQYPALSEAKIDTKTVLTVVTDFGESIASKPIDQVDHIIHSHRKSHNTTSNLLTHSKSQMENLQNTLENQSEKTDSLQVQQQQMQNQQSLDLISEKLSQFERQQSDLQAKLQCLQNQNQILDKVAQFQHQQSDLQARLQSLQNQGQLNDKPHKISGDFAQLPMTSDTHQIQASPLPNHQEQSSDKSCSTHQPAHGLHQTLLTTAYPQNATLQACQSSVCEKLTSRVQHDVSDPNSIQIPNMSQMPLPCLPQFDRADASRTSFSQFHRLQCQIENHEGALATSAGVPTSSFTGTLKKIPPEKPPRTSLIVQSPEAEVTSRKKILLFINYFCHFDYTQLLFYFQHFIQKHPNMISHK